METHSGVNEKITLCIKAFERPACLLKCLKSIRKYYPMIQINVADDSKEPLDLSEFNNLLHLKMPFYSGSSAGRNLAMNNVKTKYFCSLDDDFFFTNQTKLEKWLDILENSDIDIVSCNVENRRYEGLIDLSNNEIKLIQGNRGECYGLKLYDIVLQCWMGRTDKIRNLGGWGEYLKCQEHKDFFIRHLGKLKIAHCPEVYCHHIRQMPKDYIQYRHGPIELQSRQAILKKYNCNRLIEFGQETARR